MARNPTSRTSPTLALALVGLALAGCPAGDQTGEDVAAGTDIFVPDTVFGDVSVPDAIADTGGDADAALDSETADVSCPGCTGSACEDNSDCLSGYCLPGPSGRQCTDTCVESCPDGYGCRAISTGGTDVAFVCVYSHLTYCAPCDNTSDCVDPLDTGARTICRPAGPGLGSYCATACGADEECPDGAQCDDGHCVPVDDGACGCSWWAIEKQASTTCSTENGAGTCEGRRTCGDEGLGACDAAVPASELCNGKDDDCDGGTDEDFADLGQPCDRDDDDDLCPRGHWACGTDGARACVGDDATTEEVCNGKDDDCDGRTDETFADDGKACDSGDDDDCDDDEVRCVGGSVQCVDVAELRLEVCNGIDDDCDGQTDGDDPGLVLEACENTAGVCGAAMKPARLCQVGAWAACDDAAYAAVGFEAGSEVSCDGLDNDCDGSTDEDFALTLKDDSVVTGVGVSCGTGACGGALTQCNPSGDGTVCPGESGVNPEVCNGIDDDCDGVSDREDPDLVPSLCERQQGVCQGALHPAPACGGQDGWYACTDGVYSTRSADYQAGVELACDSLDNDCDGKTDEDFLVVTPDGTSLFGVGQACGVGACAGGFTVCTADGAHAACSSAGNARPEVCNGIDDDCDGKTDGDDPDMVKPLCEVQKGVCSGAAKPASLCVGGQWLACGGAEYTAMAADYGVSETHCDGRDEDCDGKVDDDFKVVTADGATVRGAGSACGVGGCAGGVTVCGADGISIECSSAGSAAPEVCDGEDNDCDGKLDAADPSLVRVTCANQSGVCAGALALPDRCVGGAWQECGDSDYAAHDAGFQSDAEQKCNGKDDDCDGATDEDFSITLPTGTAVSGVGKNCGAGACSGGVTACLGDQSGTWCDSSLFTAQEVCDGEDNDCDGKTDGDDPDLQLVPCGRQRGVCAGSMKPARLCQAGAWLSCDDAVMSSHDPRYDGATELRCDGVDNDCDGSSDEDFTLVGRDGGNIVGAGKACGTGACAGGVTACNPGGTGIICPGEARASAEVCNGQDDDCDAVTDAADGSLVLAACEDQDGVCAGAKHVAAECADGQWRLCAPGDYAAHDAAYTSGVESRCDGKDNDCDAATDEDFTFTGLDQSVVVGAGKSCGAGVCAGGTTVCDGAGTGLVCDREALAGQEVCDGDDDDCDGKTDAADGSLARVTCDNQNGTCAGSMRPASLCVNGSWTTCGVDVYSSFSPAYQSGLERSCDTIDNDCDGKSDEDFVYHQKNGADVTGGVGTACGVGVCAGGTLVCNASQNGVTCPSEQLAATEVCDGGDNDCDGFTDAADATLATVACEKQSGVCGGSKKPASLCVLGAWQACGSDVYQQFSTSYEDDHEVGCDALDNDCDGRSDEDFGVMLLDGRVVTGVGASCGTGLCAGGVTRCNVGRSGVECSTENRAVQETCDDVDDDCDGKTDAGDTSMTRDPCENQSGVCAGAQKLPARCAAGVWQACGPADYQAASPSFDGAAETHCDGLDNDCDTRTDEEFAWTDPAGAVFRVGQQCGKGACAGGVVQCSSVTAATCSTAAAARPEACENSDEDCDGVVDDGCDDDGDGWCDKSMLVQQTPLPAVCPNGVGDCDDTVAGVHPTASELCDGVDQDCDAATDEAWVDCGRGSCDASGSGFFATTPPDLCNAGHCAPRAPVSCGQYACVGGGAEGDVCAVGCGSDNECAASAHCDEVDGKCKPDLVDGLACAQASDCVSNHCQNGFCCLNGDCCNVATSCPSTYAQPSLCTTPGLCEGKRKDKLCLQSMCQTSGPIDDDSGCGTTTVAQDCAAGYPDKLCTGQATQPAPVCPTTCGSDAECVAGYHCDGTCVPDVGDGGSCDEASDCSSDHCQNAHCCDHGDCCAAPDNCPASWSAAPVCDASGTCQGHRIDATCVSAMCGSSAPVGDDRACNASVEANTCGLYDSRFCDGTAVQSQPQCPSTCAADSECDDAAHCDGTCVGDVPDGGTCDEASDCVSDHCTNGHCCSGDVCCAVAGDCPAAFSTPPACDDATTCRGTKDVATCVAFACGTALDVADDSACSASVTSKDCGPYPSVRCNGAVDQTSPACATSCQSNADCDANAYCRSGVCVPDEPDGGACSDDSQCQAAHCQNHFCCSGGDCCSGPNNGPIDCPSALYANAPSCDSPSTCQGSRKDPVCVAHVCTLGPTLPDDVACAAGSEASFCGLYPSVFCPGGHDQASPSCASSCGGDQDCDPGAFCQGGVCKPDLTAGSTCSAQNQCATGLTCVDGVCCTSACGGACRRCDLSGNGTCSFVGDGQDPDGECGGVSCTGYHYGFVGDECRYKADVTDAEASCDGGGACHTRDFECTKEPQAGPASPVTCDATCQDPVAGTCVGTVPGSCSNLNLGDIGCGTGFCARQVPKCVAGHENICQPGQPRAEVCNSIDDDCDTKTDVADPDLLSNDLQGCTLQVGECAGATKPALLCTDGTWDDCTPAQYQAHDPDFQAGSETTCDGLDNDCDASSDEDFSMVTSDGQLKSGVNAACGVGRCAGGHTECRVDRTGIQCSTATAAVQEVCNGVDDDCDGPTDAADASMTRVACEKTVGVCAGAMKPDALCQGVAGWATCSTATYTAYSSLYQAGSETKCDAADNDCDGSTDEDFSYTPPSGPTVNGINQACGLGACGGGHTICNGSANGIVCSTASNATAEVCDGVDNDCDGLVDGNDPDLVIPSCEDQDGSCAGSKKPKTLCQGASGWAACGAADYALASQPNGSSYQSGSETKCDGKDNDCDASTDEDFSLTQLNGAVVTGIGKSCGVGACANGTTACKGDQTGILCPTEQAPTPQPEVCDAIDNDCDGLLNSADGSMVLAACEKTAGVCSGATHTAAQCVGGAFTACTTTEYNANAALHSGWVYDGSSETHCDTLDNDCNGTTDEDFSYTGLNGASYTTVGASCGTGACGGGSITCNAAKTGLTCSTEIAANISAEKCDAVDNDCDGIKNGADITVFDNCGTQVGECAGSKHVVAADCPASASAWPACDADDYGATPGKVWEASETKCDNKDNDCDGVTESNETTLTAVACELTAGVCAGHNKPSSLCVSGAWGTCPQNTTYYGSSFNTVDLPDVSFVDVNCDGIDGTESNALFVSAGGSGTACSKAAPCAFGTALATSTTKQHIYMMAGDYSGTFDITRIWQIFGGYNATWVRAGRSTNPVNISGGVYQGQYITLRANAPTGGSASNPLVLADMNLIGTNAGGTGLSSYVVWAVSTWLNIQRCDIRGANGSGGVGGNPGTSASQTAPVQADAGDVAEEYVTVCSTSRRNGGAGRSNSCDGYSSTGGGGGQSGTMDSSCPCTSAFGSHSCDAQSGLSGAAGFSTGASTDGGGSGGSSPCASAGTGGGGGLVDGAQGAAASTAYGSIASNFFAPAAGGTGGIGAIGGAGGGGGGSGGCDDGTDSTGAGGGGGGAGGCRATVAGSGGTGGGGSFGVWAISTAVTVQGSVLTRGSGGAGGGGGTGGSGQPGGAGGSGGAGVGSGSGGNGGAGGRGGHSGGGGGGAGGVAYGIFWFGGSLNSDAASANTFNPGGGGGAGGAAGGGPRPGLAGPTGDARSICASNGSVCQ